MLATSAGRIFLDGCYQPAPLTEALRLTWGKVDLERGLIEVSGETKTSWSNRTIPVSGRVVEALQRAWEWRSNPEIYDLEVPVVPNPSGGSYMTGFESYHNFTGPLRLAMREWNAAAGWQVKDLRNAVPTALAMAGLASDASEQYMGHAPKGITARHYIPRLTTVTRGEAKAFDQAMSVFKSLVVDHVNRIATEGEAKILNFFEQGPVESEAESAQVV
jgi:integrase